MAKAKSTIPQERIDLYDRHIAAHPDIERKGAANPYTSVNGHMFSCLNKAGEIGIRLSKEDQAAFLEKHDATLFRSYGAVMRGYVSVPDDVLEDDALFQQYLTRSFEYVRSLVPKPTTRKPKK